jgi:tRNA A-37 threonylcarbamoyl transferase component Bud32
MKAGVETPTVYFVDTANRRIYVEWIDGITVKQYLIDHPQLSQEGQLFFL